MRYGQRECQFTGASDFGTSERSKVPVPSQAMQSLPSEFFPFWQDGQVVIPEGGTQTNCTTLAAPQRWHCASADTAIEPLVIPRLENLELLSR